MTRRIRPRAGLRHPAYQRLRARVADAVAPRLPYGLTMRALAYLDTESHLDLPPWVREMWSQSHRSTDRIHGLGEVPFVRRHDPDAEFRLDPESDLRLVFVAAPGEESFLLRDLSWCAHQLRGVPLCSAVVTLPGRRADQPELERCAAEANAVVRRQDKVDSAEAGWTYSVRQGTPFASELLTASRDVVLRTSAGQVEFVVPGTSLGTLLSRGGADGDDGVVLALGRMDAAAQQGAGEEAEYEDDDDPFDDLDGDAASGAVPWPLPAAVVWLGSDTAREAWGQALWQVGYDPYLVHTGAGALQRGSRLETVVLSPGQDPSELLRPSNAELVVMDPATLGVARGAGVSRWVVVVDSSPGGGARVRGAHTGGEDDRDQVVRSLAPGFTPDDLAWVLRQVGHGPTPLYARVLTQRMARAGQMLLEGHARWTS